VGTDEEKRRRLERSEVINTVHRFDVSGTYAFADNGWTLSLSIPYLSAKRSGRDGLDLVTFTRNQPGLGLTSRNEAGDVDEISDSALILKRWLRPTDQSKGNVQIGFGLDLPTGDKDVTTLRRFLPAGAARNGNNVRTRFVTVDQSIQPGDGELGVIFDLNAFRLVGTTTLYLSGTYLANPAELNGVPTFRNNVGEEIMSGADSYLLRGGAIFSRVGGLAWLAAGLGIRWEGVPVTDLFGGSNGFRRPGYAISIEPTFIRTVGNESFSLAVPVPFQRNRQRSVPDQQVPGRHGDAAFADYLILAGYSRRF
jgi:hypothetical protein